MKRRAWYKEYQVRVCTPPLYSAFAMKRFWTPFSRPFRDRFGPF
eukprot:COSAG04_NODE_16908_length_485_cov_1.183938_1_plen_43_part_10